MNVGEFDVDARKVGPVLAAIDKTLVTVLETEFPHLEPTQVQALLAWVCVQIAGATVGLPACCGRHLLESVDHLSGALRSAACDSFASKREAEDE